MVIILLISCFILVPETLSVITLHPLDSVLIEQFCSRLLKHIDLQKLSALRALDLSELKATLSPWISWNCIGQSVVSPVKSALSPTIEK
jgi:hypothetical protein